MKKMITMSVLLAVLSLAFTQVNTASAASAAFPPRTRRPGRGPFDGEGPMHDLMVNAWAEALSTDEATLEARLEDGERIFDIAADLGIEADEFYTMADEVHDTVRKAAIEEGLLTEEQAERMPGFGVPGAMGTRQTIR